MNILYISSFVYRKNSSAAIRNNKLIEGLVSIGNQVEVLTVNYHDEWIDQSLVDNHKVLGIPSISCDVFSKTNIPSGNNRKNIKKYLPRSVYNCVKNVVAFPDVDKKWLENDFLIEKKYDLIISSSDTKTSHFVAEKIFKEQDVKAKWIQIWGDPWASDVNLDFLSRRIVASSERRLLNKADKVFYVSELTALEYKSKFPNISKKIHFIGRSFYKKVIFESKVNTENHYSIFYPGSLNENRSIYNFCECIKNYNLNNDIKISLRICGYQSESILSFYEQYEFVQFLGAKNIDEVYYEFSKSNFLLFVDNGNNSSQIPGKIFDYYGTNLPIIALVSEGNQKMIDFLNKDKRTLILDKDSQQDLLSIFTLKNSDSVNEYYSPESVARRFIDGL